MFQNTTKYSVSPASVPEHNVILLHLENSGVYLLILKMSRELCADSG